jgi:uncharacterized protein
VEFPPSFFVLVGEIPMSAKKNTRLRFNFGYLLDAGLGSIGKMEIDYPSVWLDDDFSLEPMTGKFQATRTSNGLYLQGILHSFYPAECVRCLDDANVPIDIELDDLFFFRGTAPEGEFEIKDDGSIDLTPLVRELSVLSVPIQTFCRDNCAGLCPTCGINWNDDTCDCDNDNIDPRLAILKTMMSN